MLRGAPAKVRFPDTDALPVVVSVVNVAAAGVVAPMTVPLIHVVVTLKLPAVKRTLLAPKSNDEAPRPARDNDPEVAVRLSAPVVSVKPFEAVNNPAEVTVPIPVVVMLPLVVRLPFSLIVKVAEPLDCTWNATAFPPPLVSLIIRAEPVP